VALGVSETDAFKAAAGHIVGIPMGCRTVDSRRKRGRGLVQGGVLINYDRKTKIEGKAVTLRRKFKQSTAPEELVWRVTMGRAFLLALRGKDLHRCASKIEELATLWVRWLTHRQCYCPCWRPKFFTSDFMTDVQTEIL
jgi:hypothetical protein